MFGKLLMMDLKRCFSAKRMPAITAASAVMLLGSTRDYLISYSALPWEEKFLYTGAVDFLQLAMGYDVFKVIVVLLLSGLYTHCFCQDEEYHYLRMICCRTDMMNYARAKFLSNSLVILISSTAACILFVLVVIMLGYPFISENAQGGFLATVYYKRIVTEFPVLYLCMIGLQFGMVAAACSSVGVLISSYQPNAYVSIGSSGFLFFILLSLSYNTSTPFNLARLIAMESVPPLESAANPWLMFLWGMMLPGIVIVFCCMKFEKRMQWRAEHGVI